MKWTETVPLEIRTPFADFTCRALMPKTSPAILFWINFEINYLPQEYVQPVWDQTEVLKKPKKS